MRFKDFHINIKIRIIETFLARTVSGMVFPFMAIYLAAHFSVQLTGALLILNVFIGAVMNFVGGFYADIVGRKKLMAFAEGLRFVAFTIMAIANSPWFEMPLLTFFMMTVNSICWGLAGPAGQAMLIDVSTPEQRKYMFSITYWASNFSIAIGGIIGGFFFKTHLFELFSAMSIVGLIVAIMIFFFIKESLVKSESAEKTSIHPLGMFSVYKRVLKDRVFVLFFLANTLIFTMEMHLTNYIGIHLSNAMPTQRFFYWAVDGINTLGILRTENTLLVVLTSLFVVKLVSRFKDPQALLFGLTLFVVGYSFISYTTNIWWLIILMVIATIGEVVRVPVEQNYLAAIPPDDMRSTYMAVNGLTFNGANFVSSVFVSLSAFLAPLWMSIAIFLVGGIGITLYTVAIPHLEMRKRKTEEAFKTVS